MKRTIERMVKRWQKKLGISDWKVAVHVNETPDGVEEEHIEHEAYIQVDGDINSAVVYFNVYNLKSDEIESAVIHEMLHVVMKPVDNLLDTLGIKFHDLVNSTSESVVDKLTDALSR